MKVVAIVLAAGQASRYGAPKQLVPVGGVPMVRRATQAACAANGVDRVVVVLGAHAQAVRPVLPGAGEEVVVADGWAEGLAASLRTGLEAVGPGEAAIVLLADQPLVDEGLIARVIAEGLPGLGEGHQAARPVHDGVPGHPVLLGPGAAELARALQGDRGMGAVLRDLEVLVVAEGDDRATIDVDRPTDLAAAERALGPGGEG